MKESLVENIDYVVCRVCEKRLKMITTSHLQSHNTSMKEYKLQFPNSLRMCQVYSERQSKSLKARDREWVDKAVKSREPGKENMKKKVSTTMKSFFKTEEGKESIKLRSEKTIGHETSEETRQKISETNKLNRGNNNLENRRKRAIKAQSKSSYWEKQHKSLNKTSPNRFEQSIAKLLPSSFKFTGDRNPEGMFEFINGRHKNADFTFHDKTKVVEGFGGFWHTHPRNIKEMTPEEHEKDVVNSYKKIGVDCLVIWSTDLKNKDMLQLKIHRFLQPIFYEN